ncbi:hypothetical protein GCM10011594_43660 [Nakamurella endophytica]|uniref:Uncharacterized protein n=1 Tax=Nakamurella endophytica TaxID=1748367 RepID=A0A917WPB4_9ACTN|nr:hypothetical protein GCM10011594_43660 [Nakamurella endophytica]
MLIVPLVSALEVAFRGQWSGNFLVVALIGPTVGWATDRDYCRLSADERVQVARTCRTAQPSGVRAVDTVAVNRLERAAKSYRSDRIIVPIVLAVLLAAPIVAAFRQSAWWLLTELPGPLVATRLIQAQRSLDPRTQLSRLRDALSAQ